MGVDLIYSFSLLGKERWVLESTELLTRCTNFILIYTKLDLYLLMRTQKNRGNLAYSFILIHSSNTIKCILHTKALYRDWTYQTNVTRILSLKSRIRISEKEKLREGEFQLDEVTGRTQLLSFKIQIYL